MITFYTMDKYPQKIRLPTYPFAREWYWVDGTDTNAQREETNTPPMIHRTIVNPTDDGSISTLINTERQFSCLENLYGPDELIRDFDIREKANRFLKQFIAEYLRIEVDEIDTQRITLKWVLHPQALCVWRRILERRLVEIFYRVCCSNTKQFQRWPRISLNTTLMRLIGCGNRKKKFGKMTTRKRSQIVREHIRSFRHGISSTTRNTFEILRSIHPRLMWSSRGNICKKSRGFGH